MTCDRCGSYAKGGLCRECETELKFEDQANDLKRGVRWDSADDTEGDDA